MSEKRVIMFEALMLKDYQNNLVGVFTYFCKSYYFTYSFTRTILTLL